MLVFAYMDDFVACGDGQNPKQFYDFILPEIIAELNTQAAEKDVKGSLPVIAPFCHDFIELQIFGFLNLFIHHFI